MSDESGELDKLRFRELMAELKELLGRLERDDVDLDELSALVERASALIFQGRQRIEATELRVREIFAGMGEAEAEQS